ncbi:hypothetical protein LAZ67_11003112 [Cordylochernes scorpioides]|uniref:ATP-dependent DNA helicase n=1 Tax=Cordylochernes scorpioides TaxID=51811 RepID=A0ABY6KZL7_9ARAC|nr:hypothetical protein LAZ67_11003112 [Cordylochernes scorpioides]
MAEEIILRLKKKRAVNRSYLTKTCNKIESGLDTLMRIELEELLEQLNESFNELKLVDHEIETLLETDDLEKELQGVEEYREKYITWRFRANKKIRQSDFHGENIPNSNSRIDENEMRHYVPSCTTVKLPKLMISKFYGNFSEWLTFWNSFDAAIHQNNSLNPIDKFNYLKSHLGGTALNTVEGFALSADNYEKAIKLLKDRFGREDILISRHMNNLLSMRPLKTSSDVRTFRELFDNLSVHIRSLESLNVSIDVYGQLLCPIIIKLLPADLNLELNKELPTGYVINDLITFLERQLTAREKSFRNEIGTGNESTSKPNLVNKHPKTRFYNEKPIATASELMNSVHKSNECVFCGKDNHGSPKCDFAANISLNEKRSLMKKKGVCYKCLRPSHLSKFCRNVVRCSICNMSSHLDVMCTKLILDRGGSSKSPTVQDETLANLSTSPDVLLPTLRVTLKGNRTEKTARAIIDTGSQRSYILHSTAMEMEYEQSRREFFRHSLFGGSSTDVVEHEVYSIHLSDINNSYRCEFEALGQPLICGSIPPVCPRSLLEGSEELDVSDLMRDRIEVLIGADIAGRLLTDDQRRISTGLVAIRTKLGWTVMGKIPPTEVRDDISSLCVTTLLSLDLENLWKLDAVGVSDAEVEKKTQSLQAEMEEHFAHTTTRDIEGRYEVALPWVQDKERIPSNRDLAENQLSSVRRKLEEVGDMNEYGQIFEECINQGIIEYSREDKLDGVHNLPHRPVYKRNSQTSKIRPVFNASARKRDKLSLNDCLDKGPNLIEIIPRLLNKFRKYEVGVSSDIEKAFLQIGIKEEDRDAAVFEIAGVDLTGHLILKNKKKAWIVIFTCAVYGGVHLELVTSLSMEAFLQAFRRFIARRGRPFIVHSDNETNFRGMTNTLKKIDFSRLKCDPTLKNITWKFIPPDAPWWSGWWERLIGMMKQLLFRILGQTSLGYEELSTVMCDVESLMNTRPLTYLTEESEDLAPLTPSLFLHEVREVGVPDLDLIDNQTLSRKYQYIKRVREDLRERFRIEYFGFLRQEMRRLKTTIPFKVGDMVLIGQESLKRLHWSLARIIQLYPGKDGLVRVAKVKTSSGDKIRPIQKLYNLEITPEIRCRDPLTERSPTQEVRLTTEEDPLTLQQEQHHIDTPNVVSSYGRPIKRPNRLDLLNFSFPCLSRRDANSKVGEMLEKKTSEAANGKPAEAATGMQRHLQTSKSPRILLYVSGAFLIPYVLMLVFGGLPLFYLELALGQYYRSGCLTLWNKICPLMKGLGYAICFIDVYMAMYYNTIIAWAVYYLVAALSCAGGDELPWVGCHHPWNTRSCRTLAQRTNLSLAEVATSPAQEYFERYRNARALETPLQRETRRELRRLRSSEARVAATQTMQVPVQRIHLWTHKPFSGLQYNAHIDYKADSSVDIGQMSRVCQFCSALRFKDEPLGLCCKQGRVSLPAIESPPEPIFSLLSGLHPLSKSFLLHIRRYNSIFQMTSFGARQVVEQGYMPTFKVQGQVYHVIGSLLPEPDSEHKFLQIYFIDNYESQVIARCNITANLNRDLVRSLQDLLHAHNHYIQSFKAALETLPQNHADYRVIIHSDKLPPEEHERRYNAPMTNEVALLMVGQEFGPRDIVLHCRNNLTQRISEIHQAYDSLQYPLIFCRGEVGYSVSLPQVNPSTREIMQKTVSCMNFYAYRMMVRAGEFNSLLRYGMLTNQFWVDMYAKVESERLSFIRRNQKKLRTENYIHLQDALRADENLANIGQIVILPSSFTGEWQKRGLPHAHLLLWLTNMIRPNQIDEVIQAEIPDINLDPELHAIVIKQMVHGPCGVLNTNSPCMKDGKCSKKYPKGFCETTSTTEDGYPRYRRRCSAEGGLTSSVNMRGVTFDIDNRWIVPYNSVLLRAFDSHINVEYCSSVKAIKYVCKYINKGTDQAVFSLNHLDEVTQFQSGRYISSAEAVWRILGFSIHERSPPIVHLAVHLENGQRVYFTTANAENVISNPRDTTLTAFFKLCNQDTFARTLLYCEVPSFYTWTNNKFLGRKQGTPVEGYPGVRKSDVLGRVYTVHPTNAECYYLRLLLFHIRGPCSFQSLRTVEGVIHTTFQMACKALGLLEDDSHWNETLKEASICRNAASVRALFSTMLIFCHMSDTLTLWHAHKECMSEDILHRMRRDMSIPELDYNADGWHDFFLDAPGGTGKTFIINLLLAKLRLEGLVVCAAASSGIAATLLDGGRTAHSLFKLPLNLYDDELAVCNIAKQSATAEILQQCSLLIWDECTMAHRCSIEALDRTLKDLRDSNTIMGGVTFLFVGDFRQTLPVIPKGTRADEVNACLKRSHIWSSIVKLSLTINMRAHLFGDRGSSFSQLLLELGNGTFATHEGLISIASSDLCVLVEDIHTLISSVYPNIGSLLTMPLSWFSERALLAPRNDAVDKINEYILGKFIAPSRTYLSIDTVVDPNDSVHYPIEFLNSINPPGMPMHSLTLKVGAPIILLRNLNPPKLCNGIRLQVNSLHRYLLEATILTGCGTVFNGVGLESFIREVELKARVGKWDPEVKALLMFEALSPEVKLSLEEMGIRNDSSFESMETSEALH